MKIVYENMLFFDIIHFGEKMPRISKELREFKILLENEECINIEDLNDNELHLFINSFREEAEQLNTAVANILSYEVIEDLYDTMLLQNYLLRQVFSQLSVIIK